MSEPIISASLSISELQEEKKFTYEEMREFLKKYGRKYPSSEAETAFKQLYEEHGDEISKLFTETKVLSEDKKWMDEQKKKRSNIRCLNIKRD